MISLIITILLGTLIFFIFRGYASHGVQTIPAIVVNYIVCGLTGMLFLVLTDVPFPTTSGLRLMFPYALCMGFIFVTTFCSMAFTAQRLGVSVSSIAAKMSLLIPVVAALFIFKYDEAAHSTLSYIGMAITLPALILATLPKKTVSKGYDNHNSNDGQGKKTFLAGTMKYVLPFVVFIGSGLIDTGLNYINSQILNTNQTAFFSIFIFGMAFVFGSIYLIFIKQVPRRKDIAAGLILGIPNFFTIYFLLEALSAFGNDGALLFPIINIFTILLSAIGGTIFFKEVRSRLNYWGLVMCIFALFFLLF